MSQNYNGILGQIRSNKPITPLAATNFFNSLSPLPATDLIGSWHGTCVLTNHPGTKPLLDLKWTGKDFHSIDDVDPIISTDNDGGRVVNKVMGKARIRDVSYNGVVSAAMIYNERPIIDYFRRVNEWTVMGVMDALGSEADHGLFFILERIDESSRGKL